MHLTQYNKGKRFHTFPGNIQGNLNNSSFKAGYIKNQNNRALVPSNFKPMLSFLSLPQRGRDKKDRMNLSLYMSCSYTTGPAIVSPKLVTDFVNEYGKDCFIITVLKDKGYKFGEGVSLNFKISLRSPSEREERLINSLPQVFGCGTVVRSKNAFSYIVKDFISIAEKIIPFFNKYPLQGRKLEVFELLKEVVCLMTRKAHCTQEGLSEIKKIKLLMKGVIIQPQLGLELWGSNLSSTVGSPRYTHFERALVKIPPSKRSVFIGILLSDATLQKGNKGGEARLQFKQKYGQFEYLYSVFSQLSHYCSKGPGVTKATLHKRVHYGLSFTTRSLLCITELHDLFYDAESGKKIIPNNLFDLLT